MRPQKQNQYFRLNNKLNNSSHFNRRINNDYNYFETLIGRHIGIPNSIFSHIKNQQRLSLLCAIFLLLCAVTVLPLK